MTLGQFVTYMLKKSGNTVSRAEMLEMINIAQNEALAHDNSYTRTKPDPNLATTDGTYEYDSSDIGTTVRRVKRVYTRTTTAYYYTASQRRYWAEDGYDQLGFPISKIPVQTVDASDTSGTGLKIIWDSNDNPGTTTTDYFLEQYEWPTQLTSESVAMTMPVQFWTTVLQPRILDILEVQEYGNGISHYQRYEDGLKKFLAYANTSKTIDKSSIQYREV